MRAVLPAFSVGCCCVLTGTILAARPSDAILSVRDSLLPKASKRPSVGLLDTGSGVTKLTELRESDSSHPQILLSRRNFKKQSFSHIKSTILTFLVYGLLIRNIGLLPILLPEGCGSGRECVAYGRNDWIGFALALTLYLVEAITCSTRRYLSNLYTPDQVRQYMEVLKSEPPNILWQAESYHYQSERGERFNSRGREAKTKNVTHRATKSLFFRSWKDTTDTKTADRSLHLDTITNSIPFVKITLTKLVLFANRESFKRYVEQQKLFLSSQRYYDSYMDYTSHLSIHTFQPKILAVRTVLGGRGTGLARIWFFWLFTLLGWTVPYRIWFAKHCDVAEVTLTKEVTI